MASRPEFVDRLVTKVIDGIAVVGWFTEDFTLAELKTLRARQRLPSVRQGNTRYDWRFQIPTFAEVLALRERLRKELHPVVGVYPETKHPTYFRSIGLGLESPLVQQVRRAGLDKSDAPTFIQSFELTNLVDLRQQYGVSAPPVFLTSASGAPYDLASTGDPKTYSQLTSAACLGSMSGIASAVGPDKCQIIARTLNGSLGPSDEACSRRACGRSKGPCLVDFRVGKDVTAYGRAIDEQLRFLRMGSTACSPPMLTSAWSRGLSFSPSGPPRDLSA